MLSKVCTLLYPSYLFYFQATLTTLSTSPLIVVVHGDHVTQILAHGKMLATIPEDQSSRLELGIITMIGFYYLFDIEYPSQVQLAFSLLSYTIFRDSVVNPAIKSFG